MIFKQNLTHDLYRQVEKTQRQMQGFKMGSIAGNDQNALLYDFMQKFGIKCEKNMQKEFKGRDSNRCSRSTVVNCRVIHSKLERHQK